MKRPTPLILVALLLGTLFRLVEQPLVKAIALCALIVVIGAMVGCLLRRWAPARHLAERLRLRSFGWLILIPVMVVAFGAMLATQPRLHETYTPDQFATASNIDSQRGFHASEVDPAGNRYAWTEDRATLVFDFLVHQPVSFTFMVRSAAVAGGPDTPVQVVINGQPAGELRPDRTNAAFQPITLRLVPYNWGGERTEVKLLPATFKPKGDTRILGTMIQAVSVDKSETWSTVTRWIWLLWMLPILAALALGCIWAARRNRSSLIAYGVFVLCLMGMVGALAILALVVRVGFIEQDTYLTWILSSACIGACFATGATTMLVLSPTTRGLVQQVHGRIIPIHASVSDGVRRIMTRSAVELPPTRSRIMRDLLLLFFIALGVRWIWAVAIPPWQAPDEPEHYLYISYIVEQGQIPHPPYPAYPGYPQELLTSWNLTLLGKLSSLGASTNHQLPYLPIIYDYSTARNYQAPNLERRSSGGGRAISYPPLYYLFDALPYLLFKSSPILARLYAARCGSAILGALSCVFGYLLAYELRRTRQWGWALGLCMAFLPMYVFMTAVVNNDAALNLAGAALIWLTVRIYRREVFSVPLALGLGVTSGLALLTKQTIAPIVVVGGIVVLIKITPSLRSVWQETRTKLLALVAYGGSVAAVYGPWIFFRLHYFGDFGLGVISLSPFVRFFTGGMPVGAASPPSADRLSGSFSPQLSVATISLWRYLEITKDRGWIYFQELLFTNFWGNFGWLDAPLPQRVFIPIVVVYIIGGIGVLIQLGLQRQRRGGLFLLLAFLVAQALFLFIGLDYFDGYVRIGAAIGLQGRYFFPVLAPLLFLLLSGWNHLCKENGLVLRLAPLGMACLQLIGLATILARYYGVTIG
jgi:predicted membrane protein DUF2142